MDDTDWLAQRFEQHRSRLTDVAYRMLGSRSDADDAVQEAWLRLSRADSAAVHNLGGWLTTVVGRLCLDELRSRAAHREEPLDDQSPQLDADPSATADPEEEALMAESVGVAMLVVLGTLAPAERLAFVLHDMFAVPFKEIGTILGRSPNAAKQLASRARLRVHSANLTPTADLTRQTDLVTAFLAASRNGDFTALVRALAPDVVLRADATAVQLGAVPEVQGSAPVAGVFIEHPIEALPNLVEGPGVVWAISQPAPQAAFRFMIRDEAIIRIDVVFDRAQVRRLEHAMPEA